MHESPSDAGVVDAVRSFIYRHVADSGRPPSSADVARQFDCTPRQALELLKDVAAQKALTLDAQSGEIWMAHPFSAVPTSFVVESRGIQWWANCSWDMFGIPATLGISAHITAQCACCDEPMTMDVDTTSGPSTDEGVVHFLVPARDWYADIGFT